MPTLRLLLVVALLLGAFGATEAAASPVLVMDRGGHVRARDDAALPPVTDEPAVSRGAVAAAARRPRASLAAAEKTVRGELSKLRAKHAISTAAATTYRRQFDNAVATAKKLRGTRRTELQAVISTLHEIAARGQLTASRLPALFMTLERNRQWWTTGRLMSYGQRVEFSDSQLVWEYYPGQGIDLQVLGTFGKANGLWMAQQDGPLRALLDEMRGLAVTRGRALTWEYYFRFGGGRPPWASGMAQATGIQVYARASQRLNEPAYLATAKAALPLFTQAPPTGVRTATKLGARYLLYSYARGELVFNATVQTLVGLWDYAQISGDKRATTLFDAGERQLRADLPAYDTGAWSLYEKGGAEADLNYEELVTGFLQNLCDRTGSDLWCATATRFAGYLKAPPVMTLVTTRVRAGSRALVRFKLSKRSRVGMTIARAGRASLSTSAWVSYGTHAYSWKVPSAPGTYDVTLFGTDQAGNSGRVIAALTVVGKGTPKT